MKKIFLFVTLTINLFGCTLLNKINFLNKNKKINNSTITNSTSKKKLKPQHKVTLTEIINWDKNRYCTSYILTGKLIANYYSPKKVKKEQFSGYIYIEYFPKNFKISIYDKYNQKVFDKTINEPSFALCIGKSICVDVSGKDLIGYLEVQKLKNAKLIKDTLIGFKENKIVVVNYPREAQIRDLEKIIKYSYNKNGQIKEIDIKIKRVGNIKIIVDKVLCKKN